MNITSGRSVINHAAARVANCLLRDGEARGEPNLERADVIGINFGPRKIHQTKLAKDMDIWFERLAGALPLFVINSLSR